MTSAPLADFSFSPEILLKQQKIARPDFGDARVVTLGPKGTSCETAAIFLTDAIGSVSETCLLDNFDMVLDAVVSGQSDVALVPSAYKGLTKFHWHQDLELVGFFPLSTPQYGVAVPTGYASPATQRPIRVASMWEVRRIYHDVVPPSLAGRPIEWIDSDSTQHAAAIAASGEADVAVTNVHGLRRHDLTWLAIRPGVDIIWTLFSRTRA